ncbi:serine/threonine-protein kinase [Mycobacterium sp. 4D054]|uniref:serine/threonine-protein kinase n=1 Tax=unclassified Mycobacterium TaxID=2642494 RepID=UPI0021B19423|nr:serine/threonine-protein kinase [Mycobacterium sp. SMC-8]UXA13076.1 serine/threonine protein kinase [Mycobacterium sp. SMC-8]
MTGSETLAGRYELRGLLGCGGMAEVRDGWDTRLNRPVAVKLLLPNLNADPGARLRFQDEARSAAALSHPNIVAVHDFGEHDGRPFIVMERLPGRTLADLIAEVPLPAAQVRAMLDDVLAALDAAHTGGVLHRDIKPGNILLSATGDRMQVADFGIAKSGGTAHTMTGQIIGTLCYMSPERVAGAPASVADDLYAVGVMGYEAVLGRRAFPHDNPVALARAIMDAPPPPLAGLRTGADPVLAAVIDRAMSRDPRLRFGSAAQMRAALAGDAAAMSAGAAPIGVPPRPATKVLAEPLPPSAYHRAAPPQRPASLRRRYALIAAAAAAFLVAALAVAMNPFSSSTPVQPVSTSTPAPPPTQPPSPPPAPTASLVTQQPPPPAPDVKGPDKKGNNGHGKGNGKGNGANKGRDD